MTDIKPEGLEAARNAIRYLAHPETPWSDGQVAAVINAYLAASTPSPAPAESGAVAFGEDGELDAGINYAIEQLCEVLDVDPKSISWDAATETLDGDVSSVICNAIRAAYGDEWSANPEDTARIRSALAHPSPAPSASMGRVTVKALEWTRAEPDTRQGETDRWEASSILGWYFAFECYGKVWYETPTHRDFNARQAETMLAAKAACQADYEACLLAALVSPPDHGGGEGWTNDGLPLGEWWMFYDNQTGRWCVYDDGPPQVIRTGAEVFHVREVTRSQP